LKILTRLFFCIFLFPVVASGQYRSVNFSGMVKDRESDGVLPFATVELRRPDSIQFFVNTVTGTDGRFSIAGLSPGNYYLLVSHAGYDSTSQTVYIGSISAFIDIGKIYLERSGDSLQEVIVRANPGEVSDGLEKKTFDIAQNNTQTGGSLLQVLQNLPGVTVQDGKLFIRGSDKVVVLVDGKQTALTGFGNAVSLDNIPASAIEKIEIINNPSARYDANGNAGIVNIIYKKGTQDGLNGKISLAAGAGALTIKKKNLPDVPPQYQVTPKFNPSLSLNYRKNKVNFFAQGDYFYNPTLNKNEFVTRTYDTGEIIVQQTRRNRTTHVATGKAGLDWNLSDRSDFSISGLYSYEKILDKGEEPFYNKDLSERLRLWQFLEDEIKTTATANAEWNLRFSKPGQALKAGLGYSFHRENEKYFFTNTLPSSTGIDSFRLLSDEHVMDLHLDYVQPLPLGQIEFGGRYRWRQIPTDMLFQPGINSILDVNAGGKATYRERIPAFYGNYLLESSRWEMEAGVRFEYVKVNYDVDPTHNTYKSDGYSYGQPFPNLRVAYKISAKQKLAFFYNRRVDRPNEVDIRVFPKYDDAEIVKVGNPALQPQFSNRFELGFRSGWQKGYFYLAGFHQLSNGTITRIGTTVPNSRIIYNVMQNAGKSYRSGTELLVSQAVNPLLSLQVNGTIYHHRIDSFSGVNLYPEPTAYFSATDKTWSGTLKGTITFHLPKQLDIQFIGLYLGRDLIPQGRIGDRFSLDMGAKIPVQRDRGELFFNATDMLNTMNIRREIKGTNFSYISTDYYETQVFRIGYSYKF